MFELFSNNKKSKILEKPGDKMIAKITSTNRKVIKISKNDGANKYSITTYPNKTIVETKTTKFDGKK